MNLIAELQYPKLICADGLYLLGVWLLVEVAGTVLPMPDAPDWIASSIVIALVAASRWVALLPIVQS